VSPRSWPPLGPLWWRPETAGPRARSRRPCSREPPQRRTWCADWGGSRMASETVPNTGAVADLERRDRERFTFRAFEAIESADAGRRRLRNPRLEGRHLAQSLLEQQETIVAVLLSRLSIDDLVLRENVAALRSPDRSADESERRSEL